MTAKRIPVKGDWITSPKWNSDFFEVDCVNGISLWLKVNGHKPVQYPVDSNEWVFLPMDKAAKLLEEAGYTVTPPKPKLTGNSYVYRHTRGQGVCLMEGEWRNAKVADYELIAIVPWTEGDGITPTTSGCPKSTEKPMESR